MKLVVVKWLNVSKDALLFVKEYKKLSTMQ